MTEENPQTPAEYLEGLRKQFPYIKPYDDNDWDWTWGDEGYQYLESCDFGMAELTFQRLIASRPDDADGFEGLAMVYKALGHKVQAIILIDEAVRLANQRFSQGYIDEEVIREIAMEQRLIHDMPDPQA
jgi:tetratricopeptide (TPR) repeat protein